MPSMLGDVICQQGLESPKGGGGGGAFKGEAFVLLWYFANECFLPKKNGKRKKGGGRLAEKEEIPWILAWPTNQQCYKDCANQLL